MYYNANDIEKKWQKIWDDNKIFHVSHDINKLKNQPKYYILDMFPYPSGSGLHVGHIEGYTASDVIARMKKMQGYNVLHPIGWDSFGLPTERTAIKNNIHPSQITLKNINNFKLQIKRLGFSYDWSREINTSDPKYYKWTQWIFLKLYHKKLAYLDYVPVNWCPALNTVLANEEIKDGKYIETGDLVEKKYMKQWMLKITHYAERLLQDLDTLDWPNNIKIMQKNWIGKSIGTNIKFVIKNMDINLTIFTTKPETIFGVTFCVLSTRHKLINQISTKKQETLINEYIKHNKNEPTIKDNNNNIDGIFTGNVAIHPISGQKIPIWISNYIMHNYGDDALMGVPAHNKIDHKFATKYKIPIINVILNNLNTKQAYIYNKSNILINSHFLNNSTIQQASYKIIDYLKHNNIGYIKTKYKLKDWLFSRQRYWGEPFPIIYINNNTAKPLTIQELPVQLPLINNYKPTNNNITPLSNAPTSWLQTSYKQQHATRELNTMPQWAGSCWYYLRYLDPNNDKQPFDKEKEKYWMPVDLYIGGIEHAVLHLLYARFWHKVLYDCNLVHTLEPFKKLFNQGAILSNSFKDKYGKYYSPKDICIKNNTLLLKHNNTPIFKQIEKMSKSKLNVINPMDIIKQYGADTLRIYELFMGPLEQIKPWQTNGMKGIYKFLHKTWTIITTKKISSSINIHYKSRYNISILHILNQTIKIVTKNTENLKFNTAISQMMIFINHLQKEDTIAKQILNIFLQLLSPYAPHIAEELWSRLGNKKFLLNTVWPKTQKIFNQNNKKTIIIQINGKLKDKFIINKNLSEQELKDITLQNKNIKKLIYQKKIINIIIVKNKLINIVIK